MSDEEVLHRDAARGERAKALLENEMLAEAFATLDAEYIKLWKATSARDQDARERIWAATTVITKVKEHLRRIVSDGVLARAELETLTK